MDIQLPISILPQPNGSTCGPTCLHAVLNYFEDPAGLDEVIAETQMLDAGGTLAVFLACAALKRGHKATIYSYNLQMFDPTWFTSDAVNITERLQEQAAVKEDPKLCHATNGYLEFLKLGGQLKFTDLNTRLLRGIIKRRLPVLTGLSATYLYRTPREFGDDDHYDDIRGYPSGHFVILSGYNRQDRTIRISDPYLKNPLGEKHQYSINIDRVICAILLGVLTYDANLLVIQPKHR